MALAPPHPSWARGEPHPTSLSPTIAQSMQEEPKLISQYSGSTPSEPPKKKPKRKAGTPKLSFGMDDEEDEGDSGISNKPTPKNNTAASRSQSGSPAPQSDAAAPKRKFAPNASIGAFPKALTKRSLLQESQAREALRKEFLGLQERVKAAPIAIPFVFYDGSNVPGGVCRVAKGDFVWKFLDGSRKVGAEVGAGVGGEAGKGDAKARREWAKVGVDDLMMVRGEIIIPPVSFCLIEMEGD